MNSNISGRSTHQVPRPEGRGNDGREYIDYEIPMRLDEFLKFIPPESPPAWMKDGHSWCSRCGSNSQRRATSELWVVNHHHSSHPIGQMLTYCSDHLSEREWRESGQPERGRGRRGAVCPTCHVTMPLTGICDECG